MAQKREITFASSAVDDLEAISVWYQDQKVPNVGTGLIKEIIDRIENLADFLESEAQRMQGGRVVSEFGIANLREIIHPPFRIVYRFDGSKIRIIRVWRSDRILKMME